MTVPVYRFGDCLIDPSARELHRAAELVTLSPKVFDCLAYLIEHRDRAVGRDELIAAVWGKVDVSDTLLGQTVLKARRAIGDTGNEQYAIRTVPRFGYRWIAPLSEETTDATAVTDTQGERLVAAQATKVAAGMPTLVPPQSPAVPAVRSPWNWLALRLVVAAGVLLVAWVAIVMWRTADSDRGRAPFAPAAAADPMFAILPANISESAAEWSWLRLGLMDLVASRLRAAGLVVAPSDNVVALLRNRGSNEATAAVIAGTGALRLISPEATRSAGGWSVRLILRAGVGNEEVVEAGGGDPVLAMRIAADRLLARLGHPQETRPSADLPMDELLARVDAAQLTDDLGGARTLIEHADPALQAMPDLRLRLAQIDYRAGRLGPAEARLRELLVELRPETNPVLRARTLNALGAIAIVTRRYADAKQSFDEAIDLLDRRKQPAAIGQAYTGLAVSHAARGHYEAAQAAFSRARVALELAGDGLALARVEENEGIVAVQRGHYAQALAAHQGAARRFVQFGAINELILTRANAASVELILLQPASALAIIERSLPLLAQIENRHTSNELQFTYAKALARNGRLAAARAALGQLIADAADDSDRRTLIAGIRLEQARLDFAAGDAASAAILAEHAVNDLDDADHRRDRAQAWILLARSLRDQGRVKEASAWTAKMIDWAADQDETTLPSIALLARAEDAWVAQKFELARRDFVDALARATQDGAPADTADVVISWASRLIAAGELESAGALVGQLASCAGQEFQCALLQLAYYHALGQGDAWHVALERAQGLAGERTIPAPLRVAPTVASKSLPPG